METIKISCSCMNYLNGNGASGTLYIYDDRMHFHPSTLMKITAFWALSNLKDMYVDIKSIVGCERKMLGRLDFMRGDGSTFQIKSFTKKDTIINEVEKRRAALYRKEGKTVPPFVKIG